ncbi:hypothetical protein ECL_00413 [Enterobacter cloacae subsp. cloacae ATCC 13047]|uniref:Uncharacterized protein n=1 Tax=Enterobacter cloacae subsp. cloacae (strain ATCC 13047 / DSM 30054 / NBRC 13535 / NCTC 10005 / WDCM 00083 / NCDC 279-56) TaxID=716541 RepID=A0A0H3CED2_ENTCC|nr:hypothetical protein ECL_00413 [Enterobacter cloacae subsp. cloacae ATCC 13047]
MPHVWKVLPSGFTPGLVLIRSAILAGMKKRAMRNSFRKLKKNIAEPVRLNQLTKPFTLIR